MRYVSAVSVAIFVLAALFGATPVAGQQPIMIKLGNVHEVDEPIQAAHKRFAELVAKRTNNQIQVQIFPASQLGTEQELLEGVQMGSLHMSENSTAAVGRFLPELEAFTAPYAWRNVDHMLKVARGPIGQELIERLVKARGMRILDLGWLYGHRDLTTKGKPIYKPADLRGVKIRTMPTQVTLETIRAMGANAVPMDWKEVYLGLQTGMIDGQETPPSIIYSAKLFEVQKFVMLTEHITQNQIVLINEKFYQGLSPEFQRILQETAVEAGNYMNELVLKAEKDDLERLKAKGMTVIQPDVEAFRQATKEVYKKLADKWQPNFWQRLQDTK
jgi:tripartite ATP-independent transporter DctP family solute receptor